MRSGCCCGAEYKMLLEEQKENKTARSGDAYMLQQMNYYGVIVATGSCYALLNILSDIF